MARKAGVITINLNAGTAKFLADMDPAITKVRQFGAAADQSGKATHAFGIAAASGGIRELEGRIPIRAVERFLAYTLNLGPALSAAFPIIGAVALGRLLVEVGEKAYEFFRNIQEAPTKISSAFRELNAPLALTNAELQVANDRLENDISKLEGRRQNGLKLALDEAKAAADKLAVALFKDLDALEKLLKENEVGFMRGLLGEAKTADLEKFAKKFAADMGEITGRGTAEVNAAQTPEAARAARERLDADRRARIDEARDFIEMELVAARESQDLLNHPKRVGIQSQGMAGLFGPQGPDQAARIKSLEGLKQNLELQSTFIGTNATNADLQGKKSRLEADRDAAALTRPFSDAIKELDAKLEGVRAKLAVVGQSEGAKTIAKGYAEAVKEIEKVNKSLEQHHRKLTDAQMGQISSKAITIAQIEAEEQWKTKLAQTTAQINDRIRSQELLTSAIGKGFAAFRSASVESQLMGAVGAEHFNDPAWMKAHAPDVAVLRGGLGREFDAKQGDQVTGAIHALNTQIDMERNLAAVQAQGAEAVRLVTLAYKLREMTAKGATQAQIKAEIDLYNAQRQNVSATNIAAIDQRAAATRRLGDAVILGAEAERKAALENKYAEMARGGTPVAEIERERIADQAQRQRELTTEALKTGMAHKDQVENLNLQIAALEQLKSEGKDNLEIEISLRDLENQRLHSLAAQVLQLRGAKDGIRAFFLDMQTDAKSAAQSIYEALHASVDRLSDEFAKLLTGQKTSFGKMVGDIGQGLIRDSIRATLQHGLGALGKLLGFSGGKRGDTPLMPLYVNVVNLTGVPSPAGASAGGGSSSRGGGVIGNIFGTLLSGIGHREGGGSLSPADAYWVGESGPELLIGASGRIASHAESRQMVAAGGGHYYTIGTIDARGTDPLLVEQRVRTAIEAVHQSAVETAAQVVMDRDRRVPKVR